MYLRVIRFVTRPPMMKMMNNIHMAESKTLSTGFFMLAIPKRMELNPAHRIVTQNAAPHL